MRRRLLLALAGATVVLGLTACAPAGAGVPGSVPAGQVLVPAEAVAGEPVRAIEGAFEFGTGPTVIDAWVDFFCPYCRMFEEGNGALLRGLVDRGAATVRIHPIAILDRASMGTKYSTRSANAFACVAEIAPADALDYMARLYEDQPEEGTAGRTDEELAAAAPSAAGDCIREGRFADWVGQWTQGALDAGVQGTPTVFVNGAPFTGSLQGPDFRDFVAALSAAV